MSTLNTSLKALCALVLLACNPSSPTASSPTSKA